MSDAKLSRSKDGPMCQVGINFQMQTDVSGSRHEGQRH